MKTERRNIFFSIIMLLAFCVGHLFYGALAFNGNDGRVEPESDVIYYINVTYDGKDRGTGTEGGDQTNVTDQTDDTSSQSVNIFSGRINAADKIPEGMEFVGFVENEGGIGATLKDGTPCSGYIVQDGTNSTGSTYNGQAEYTRNGLHYTASDRTVRFTVNELQAGGKLTVGIIVRTPSAEPEERKDFYNSANAKESNLSKKSNDTHLYILGEGADDVTVHTVSYEYTGTVPDGAEALRPSDASYAPGANVGVASPVSIEGYTFSGWSVKSGGVTISDGTFTMPDNNVVLQGSFTKINPYKVTYVINGTKPENYVAPTEKSYYTDELVTVDSLAPNAVVDGYKFSGWSVKSGGVTISDDGTFDMPSNDVVLEGSFEEIKYKVTYAFYDYDGVVLPPNPEQYLPAEEQYVPGVQVQQTANISQGSTIQDNTTGWTYKFLGWDKVFPFLMPEEDVLVRGEWQAIPGTFSPTIIKQIVDGQETYKIGNTVTYKITVTNTASFPIQNVSVQENNEKAKFIASGNNYTLEGDRLAKISQIPANGTVTLYANYIVDDNDTGIITNTVKILSAIGDGGQSLDENGNYTATSEFNVEDRYIVKYEINGQTPDGYEVPSSEKYYVDDNVTVAPNAVVDGYRFSGWRVKSGGVTISDGKFTMPANNVVLEGSFEKIYNVSYEYSGTVPEGANALLPTEASYTSGTNVTVADPVNLEGYRFSGWSIKSGGATISNGAFTMPANDVVLEGGFEKLYTVHYEFDNSEGAVLPPNSEQYLPADEQYVSGVQVQKATGAISQGFTVEGSDGTQYKFLGWNKTFPFVMPAEDVVVHGEWSKSVVATFVPTITKKIVDKKESYEAGDTVEYKITVTNTASFAIQDVIVRENNGKAKFVENSDGYTLEGARVAKISEIAAGESVILYASYTVGDNDSGTIKNEVEITSATGSDGQTLKDGAYKATSKFSITSGESGGEEIDYNDSDTEDDGSSIIDDEEYVSPISKDEASEGESSDSSSTEIGSEGTLGIKTGDETNVYMYLAIIFASMICLIAVTKFGKSQKVDHEIH